MGKSTWIRQVLPQAEVIDLLESKAYLELSRDPGLLESRVGPLKRASWVFIDEIQKIPALLDEVHRLIELKGLHFALSGSSARKLKRGIAYYRTGAGAEIDLVIEVQKRTETAKAKLVCIEVKRSKRWERKWEAPMRSLALSPGLNIERMIGVYSGSVKYRFDGVKVLPVAEFLALLHQGGIF
ncbi:MAG: AAA family ATPase [Planctomycetes bacterium]|nr:AAA family ATPase [Planctomycetota bacterium]